jgi:hypothetical protein
MPRKLQRKNSKTEKNEPPSLIGMQCLLNGHQVRTPLGVLISETGNFLQIIMGLGFVNIIFPCPVINESRRDDGRLRGRRKQNWQVLAANPRQRKSVRRERKNYEQFLQGGSFPETRAFVPFAPNHCLEWVSDLARLLQLRYLADRAYAFSPLVTMPSIPYKPDQLNPL